MIRRAIAAAALAALAQPAVSAPRTTHVVWEPASQTLTVSTGSGCVSGMIRIEHDYAIDIDAEARRIAVSGSGRATGRDGGPIPAIVTADCGGARGVRETLEGAMAGDWDLFIAGELCRTLTLPIGIGLPERMEIFGAYGVHRDCQGDAAGVPGMIERIEPGPQFDRGASD